MYDNRNNAAWEGGNIEYECLRCMGTMTTETLNERGGEIKCIHCGYRALKKNKNPIVKRVKAV
jgi:DNA-directed RNA polymerase subunit RPC12/RpoP